MTNTLVISGVRRRPARKLERAITAHFPRARVVRVPDTLPQPFRGVLLLRDGQPGIHRPRTSREVVRALAGRAIDVVLTTAPK